ncbi:DUF866 domain-containing protein [Pelomyxa schiedti]|nr:DUF866 domain-containing protein [Pelomyxa schiedti]
MPVSRLTFGGEVTNIRVLFEQNTTWLFQLKCLFCGECPEVFHRVDTRVMSPISNKLGAAHVVKRCKVCKREGHLNVIHDSRTSYLESDNGNCKTIALIDCRGLGVINWKVEALKGLHSTSSTPFQIVLSDPDGWTDWDEASQTPVEVREISFGVLRGKH